MTTALVSAAYSDGDVLPVPREREGVFATIREAKAYARALWRTRPDDLVYLWIETRWGEIVWERGEAVE